jgi:hypothetical protein
LLVLAIEEIKRSSLEIDTESNDRISNINKPSAISTIAKKKKQPQPPTRMNNYMAATKSQTLGGEIAFRKLEDDRGVNLTIEKVLNEYLIKLKSILLKNNAIKLNHDQNMISHHVDKRSQEAIEEELSRLIIKLVQYKGPSLTHRATAYSQLASQLHQELEGQIFNGV